MDSTESEQATPDEGDEPSDPSDLVKHLRQKLSEEGKARKAAEAKLSQRERNDLFDQAGIPAEGTGALLRQTLADRPDLTAEQIREEAIKYKIVEPPAPAASEEEVAAHEAMSNVGAGVPAQPPDALERLRQQQSPEDLRAVAKELGIEIV